MARIAGAFVLFLLGMLLAAGCGGEDEEEDAPDSGVQAASLARLLPTGELPGLIAADVAAAREANGLAADADPLDGFPGGSTEEQRFAGAFIGMRDVTSPIESPIRTALDHGAITAYAGNQNFGRDAVVLVATSQPFDEIATSLEGEGYELEGDVLVGDGLAPELIYTAVAEADGYIVLGSDPALVGAIAEGSDSTGPPEEVELLDGLDGPVMAATSLGSDCLDSITIEDRMDGTAELRLNLSTEPDPEGFGLDDEPGPLFGYSLDEPTVDGDALAVEIESNTDTPVLSPIGLLNADVPAGTIYDCG